MRSLHENEAQVDVAVIVLTFEEERNLAQCLESVCGWAKEVFVLDSHSRDGTEAVARRYDCHFFQNPFQNYSQQRNHALRELPIRSTWVLFLDADEWIPADLRREIGEKLAGQPRENGFYLNRRFIWLGAWIKRGYYPTWIMRLFRHGFGVCEDRAVNEHVVVEGPVGFLKNDFIHQDRKSVGDWISKHNHYATREARELIKAETSPNVLEIKASFLGSQVERKRWVRNYLWNRLPPLVRPPLFFIYRYLLRGGILEGRKAFTYHFLQALWFPLLVDIKYLELKAVGTGSLGGNPATGQNVPKGPAEPVERSSEIPGGVEYP